MKLILAMSLFFSSIAFADGNYICEGAPDNFVISVSTGYVKVQVSGDKDLNDMLNTVGSKSPFNFARGTTNCYLSYDACFSVLFDDAHNKLLVQSVKSDYTTILFNKIYSCRAF